ncbi:protein kinase domain-containing protein [Brevibacterium jeotgali]|uniref:non-specific serine/threonine protein kinase n=1 Tax=Brevibacterium jeotgali TaxID=1262550 RepID=A0A2H1L6L0_9MICO|nr:PASTA domain-containing protein [Brevibacterium jeotgali]TWC02634.1 serine/threonine-protein kinase [Brevibacterium jeotgali]SMY12544.1 serine/threonine protein kinase [Brevibacterium jeotgali]
MTTLTDPLIGQVLDDRYRIDDAVARGGMAMVYKGTDLRLDRVVALKIMHRHLLDDEGFVERFQREARSAATLIHPNLVAVHDTGRDGDSVYLVMEYLPNVTLRKELRHRGTLTPRQAVIVLDAILAGLEAVHSAGMIHRDLKPDNVLLGADGQIKLADFGLARAVSAATTTKTLMGTVGYVAPELVTRTGADGRTDLYTVGIMLYEMLTGFQPYTDDVAIQVAYRHVHDDVPPPSDERPGLSPRFDALVLWATSRDPEDRPQTATALREAAAEARAALTDEELDLDHEEALDDPAFATRPLLVPTATILGPGADSAPVRTGAGTDEIPYLDDESSADDPSIGAPAGAAAETDEAEASVTDSSQDGVPATAAAVAGTSAAGPDASVSRRRRRRGVLLGLVAVLVTALLTVGAAVALTDRATVVPDVTAGQDPEEFISLVEDAGLRAETADGHSDTIPEGRILDVDPGAGTELDRGSVVTVTVSQGEELFTVPDVTGSAEADARTTLESAGMVLGKITREFSDDAPEDAVVSQGTPGGETAAKGTPVDLVISKGVEPVSVPIVTGLDYDTAFGNLAREGFRISRDDEYSDDVAKGKVISQSPDGGQDSDDGALVMLTVSKGRESADGSSGDGSAEDDSESDGSSSPDSDESDSNDD